MKLIEIKKILNIRSKNNDIFIKSLDKNIVNIHSQKNQPMNVFPMTVKNNSKLKKIKSNLEKNNIQFGTYYPFGLHEFPVSKLIQKSNIFTNTDYVKNNIVTVPCHSKINIYDIKKISNIINETWEKINF